MICVKENIMTTLSLLMMGVAAPGSALAHTNAQAASELTSEASPPHSQPQGGPYCIQNILLASNGGDSFLSDNGTFYKSCQVGEKWTISKQGDGSYCIQNNLLANNGGDSFLSDNGTFWGDCLAGERWTLIEQEDGSYCIQNNLLANNGGDSFLSDNGTFYKTCLGGEKWTIYHAP